jgi:alcohol dehydrogenase (cytochrome c)
MIDGLKKSFCVLAAAGAFILSANAQQRDFVPVTDAMLEDPAPEDWPSWRRTQSLWGYSPLDQVNRRNVSRLQLVWTRPLGVGIQEGTPLVYDGVMYFPNPNDFTQAIDAVTGNLIWEYRRPVQEDNSDYLKFPSINRNLAIYDNLILDNGADNYAYALDARTGELVWETQILDYRRGGQHSSGPIVGNGLVVSGRSCEEEAGPVACVIIALDAKTGEERWRTELIPRPGEPGDETWGDVAYEDRRQVGSWMVPSYDPELNRFYAGTSVTAPTPKFMLAGNDYEYLYHNSTLAIDADTGEIEWYMQHVVDHWDLDHPFERVLIETEVAPDPESVPWINPRVRSGDTYKVITGVPGKTGLYYTVDRESGQFLWARPTVYQNVITEVNTESGRGAVNPEATFSAQGQTKVVCPSLTGGKNYHAGAYSPQTDLMFYPLHNLCMEVTPTVEQATAEDGYAIRTADQIAPGTENVGTLEAISVVTGETAWKFENRAGQTSVIATGGGLVFGGDVHGRFRAFDQRTGEVLWEVNLGSQIAGFPATFAVGGKQYIAVSTGSALNTFSLASLATEIRAGTANNLYVFALP